MKYLWLYFLLSLAVLIPGTISLVRYGLSPSIDFTGGTNILWQSSKIDELKIREVAIEKEINIVEINHVEDTWNIITSPIEVAQYQDYLDEMKNRFTDLMLDPKAITELSFDSVGPALGAELIRKTLYAIALSATLILLYIAYRFQNFKFGASAILAMLHDTLVLLGVFSLLGHYRGVQVDTLFVTALLTILSFSVHDTIVVYDRIRELKKRYGYLDFVEIVNRAVVETMGRSLNNSLTIIFMLLSMYLLGGDSTKWFIFALLVGTISGTYSSTFTAAPLLVLWDRLQHRQK